MNRSISLPFFFSLWITSVNASHQLRRTTSAVLSDSNMTSTLPPNSKLFELMNEPYANVVPDKYIVTFTDDVPNIVQKVTDIINLGSSAAYISSAYSEVVKAVTITNLDKSTLNLFLDDKQVVAIEKEIKFKLAGTIIPDVVNASGPPPLWNLDRINQDYLPLDGNLTYAYTGKGVEAYIVDSGMRLTHTEFEGRAICGYSTYNESNCVESFSHGTGVAGIVGGKTYGVAKDVTLISVRRSDKDGNMELSYSLAALDYIYKQKQMKKNTPMVVNYSLGGPKSLVLNEAVSNLVKAGVVVVVSAGNDRSSACELSPQSSEHVITVGATDWTDTFYDLSNTGPCVDILAPGVAVISPTRKDDMSVRVWEGTSFSAPVVTGVVAMYLEKYPMASPIEVARALKASAVKGVVKFPLGRNATKNRVDV